MSKKSLFLPLLGALALTLACLPAAAADDPSGTAVAAPAPASEPPAGCAAGLDLLAASPAPVCAAPAAPAFQASPALALAGRTCRCSCGTVPCKTSADCGGGICGAGITCC